MAGTVIAVVGPTCTGKTTVATELALRLAPAELINADSRQVLRGLHVGTCAPSAAELRGVPCHLLELADPGEPFTVADWVARARATVALLQRRGVTPVVVGGTGLYVSALVDGFDFGSAPPQPQERAARSKAAASPPGLAALGEELRSRDPELAERVDLRNPRRVVRALEILDVRSRGSSPLQETRSVPAMMIGLDPPRQVHEAWVERRTARLFGEGGLLEEVERARRAGVGDAVLGRSGIGYREALDVLDARASVAEAVSAVNRRTLRYAKAQRTYWRRDSRVAWYDPTFLDGAALAAEVGRGVGQHGAADLRRP